MMNFGLFASPDAGLLASVLSSGSAPTAGDAWLTGLFRYIVGFVLFERSNQVEVDALSKFRRREMTIWKAAAFGCLVVAGAAWGQLRSDLIESQRVEKETRLTPETAPKAERRLIWF